MTVQPGRGLTPDEARERAVMVDCDHGGQPVAWCRWCACEKCGKALAQDTVKGWCLDCDPPPSGRVSSPNIDAQLRQNLRDSMPDATDEQIDALMAEAKRRGLELRESSVFPHGIPPCSYCGEATLHICPDAAR